MAGRWSSKEVDILKNYYSFRGDECSVMLSNRSLYAIIRKACELGIKHHAWTDDEVRLLKEHYPTGGSITCVKFMDRSLSAIRCKAYEVGIDTKCKNGKTIAHRIVSVIGNNRVIAICPHHGDVEHSLEKHNRSPRCLLCRMEYNKSSKARKLSRQWQKQQMDDPRWRYAHRLRVQLRQAIRSKKIGCFRFLPYSPNELRDYLETIRHKQKNRCPSCDISYDITGFQIDHIIPLASANSNIEILKLFTIKNLSLLCGSCNSRKGKQI